ncbi:hypothetical protein CMO86_00955 [Candidatus Woesearchaeota archaeon]|jgi:hypothetical protein|nr:hypothetical protein [Candidatus Woesearchaeota archaeon]|tara:strand:- start:122 stop:442 length:321 start_codon:yes stop_codon:yes gene_type:complete
MIQKSNARHKKSQYEKYVVMAHSQTNKLKLSYDGYLRFKELTEVIDKISNSASDSKSYLYGNEMYQKKITQSEALKILDNIYNGKWDATTEKCLLVANQIGMNIKA